MGQQLLFCVEAKKESKSDWVYIKETIDFFYQKSNELLLKPIYFDGKGNFDRNKIRKQIRERIRGYNRNGTTVVVYCIDTDNIFADPDRVREYETIRKYCDQNNYEFIWFCRDVEEVYWGERVSDSEKVKMSQQFRKNNRIRNIAEETFVATKENRKKSNIVRVLDKYLQRK